MAAKYHRLTEGDYELHKAMVVPLVRILVPVLFTHLHTFCVYLFFSPLPPLPDLQSFLADSGVQNIYIEILGFGVVVLFYFFLFIFFYMWMDFFDLISNRT